MPKFLLRDKVGILLIFIMPIILVIVITSIQSSTFQLVDKNKLPVLICNTDTGQASLQFIAKPLIKLDYLTLTLVQCPASVRKNLFLDAMHKKDAMLGIIIPSNFSSKIEAKAAKVYRARH